MNGLYRALSGIGPRVTLGNFITFMQVSVEPVVFICGCVLNEVTLSDV